MVGSTIISQTRRHTPNVPNAILDQVGDNFYQRLGTSLAYDTRNSTQLPNHGQRTELSDRIQCRQHGFLQAGSCTPPGIFPALFKGHVH